MWPQEVLLTLSPRANQVHQLARQRTVLEERNTEDDQINSDPQDFTPGVDLPVATIMV